MKDCDSIRSVREEHDSGISFGFAEAGVIVMLGLE